MSDPYNLQRFIDAQEDVFETALAELSAGSKQSHWMWFIFPQLAGLGRSPTAKFYGIGSLDEARAYLEHPLLGPPSSRLRRSLAALGRAALCRADPRADRRDETASSLTLFDQIEPAASSRERSSASSAVAATSAPSRF